MANNVFNPGDLVISIYGQGAPNDGTTYGDNQASPITLEDLSTTGVVRATLVLPQTSSTTNGVTQYAISGEYGSSSEGSLSLSTDGKSLTIAGYAVNAQTYNSGGAAVYGNAALAQSTSVQGGQYTAVQRVIADVRADGTVDTSTALYNVANTNNPRSAVTDNGSSFYLSGQGVKGDKTQGVFYVQDGASSATAIDNTTDTRTLLINNGTLYVSRDSKQGTGGTDNIATYGGEPTTATAPTTLTGINKSVTLAAGQGNSVNGSSGSVNLSPENFYFANPTTLYVADAGIPKQGGVGNGGLQKWSFANGTWKLDYTLSSGLNLVNSTTATSGTAGLIGLTGQVSGNSVSLYATNATIGDTDQTYLYGITDNLAATSMPTGESFTALATAAPDTNIRGVAFAPSASMACYCAGTLILTAEGQVPVERLAIGDHVVTASGDHRAIRWIGHRSYAGRFANANSVTLPICFKAGSLGDNTPSRDLWVSPKHAMYLDGVLIPAECLVNGVTVVKAAWVDDVTYYHVELDSHDVLVAEGALSESFIDDNGRGVFHNHREFANLYPDAIAGVAVYCAPRLEQGHRLDSIRRKIARRAGLVDRRPAGPLAGHVEVVDGGWIRGWAVNSRHPQATVCLDLIVDGVMIGHVLANRSCREIGLAGAEMHGFETRLPQDSVARSVAVYRSIDGARLPMICSDAA